MKPYLTAVALTLLLAYLADIRITFSPFAITVNRPWQTIGIILIMSGAICLKAQWYNDGLKRGAEIKEEVREEINEQQTIKESI